MNNIIKDNFFYIDSTNIKDVKDSLYGFYIVKRNNEIKLISSLKNEVFNKDEILNGQYIYVKRTDNGINIFIDDFSSFYIYYYEDNDFYALSNSFYILLENIKKKNKKLTFDKITADEYIQCSYRSYAVYDTLINEIKVVPIFTDLLLNEKINFIEKKYNIDSVDILSKEGIDIIDNWINKYASIIHALSKTKYHIQVDLSGGFDSRVIFSLINYSNINWNNDNIHIFSKVGENKGTIKHLSNDFEIASKIASKLGLNIISKDNYNIKTIGYSGQQEYDILKNCFMGVHKEGYFCVKNYVEPLIHFGGVNGEIIRWSIEDLETIKKQYLRANPIRNSQDVYDRLKLEFDNICKSSKTNNEALLKMYMGTLGKNHFGMSIFNRFLGNSFLLSPFNDKELLKLHTPKEFNKNLVFALIIYRTTPEIFDIEFTNNKKFDDNIIEVVKAISEKYPINKNINETYSIYVDNAYLYNYDKETDGLNGNDVLYNAFLENKELFISKYGEFFDKEYAEKIYDYANDFYLNKDNFFRNKWINCLTSIIEVFKILYE